MKITCQSCQSKYNVADEKVQGKIVKIRCRKCGSTIVVQGNGGAAANGSGASSGANGSAGAETDATQWHVNAGEGEPRTMSIGELVEAYNAGTIAQDTFIWTDGMDDWKPLSEVEAVVAALHGAAAPASAVPVAPEPAFRAVEEPAYTAPAQAAAAPVQFAAEAPAEPRRAAVVKRDARARDLFGGGGVGGEEVQTSAPAVPQMMSHGGGGSMDNDASKLTGQRNENSVLFSLAVLTKDADERPAEVPAPRPSSKNMEDSGLIDLKALALKAESMRPAAYADANAFASPLGGLTSAPLGSPMGVLGSPLGEAPPKSKLPLIIGLGAGTVLVLVLGIFIGVKVLGSSAPAPDASGMASSVPTATAEPTVTASATAAPTASVEAPAPSASVAVKPKPVPVAGGTVYHPPSGGAAKPAGGAATERQAAPRPRQPRPPRRRPAATAAATATSCAS